MGFVYESDGVLLRQIDRAFARDWDAFDGSPLRERLVADGMLIDHETVTIDAAFDVRAYAVIRPRRIDVISYPYEWAFSQLRDAALLTLEVQAEALRHGFSLRDASAYNVQFQAGKPILIDSLSLAPYAPGAPWLAYRQFCEHFLGPLAVMAYRDIALRGLLQANLDGIPLALASRLLPQRTLLRLGLASHIHLHSRAQSRYAESMPTASDRPARSVRLLSLVESLRQTVAGLTWKPTESEWSDYNERASYSEDGLAAKDEVVRSWVTGMESGRVWDLGANVGRYSRIAAGAGHSVVALDGDASAVERLYGSIKSDGEPRILPLVVDLMQPTPAMGWAGTERRSLSERANADLLLALALVHHLAISRNVPLTHIAAYLAELGSNLVIEFVPKDDPMARRLLSRREDIFEDYTVDGFRAAFAPRWEILREAAITDSQRSLFLMRKRGG